MEILVRPIVTEKMTIRGNALNQYGFIVDNRANKIQIRQAIEEMYNVTVESVNTMRYRGKSSLRYTKKGMVSGRKNNFKKAIVQLVASDKIDFYSNI